MNFYKIVSDKPPCSICGLPMKSWNPFATVHKHNECISEEISNKLIDILKKELE